MLRINNRGFKRSYVYGGTGIFDSIAKTVSSVLGKQAVKQAATQVAQKAASVAGKKLGEKGVEKVSSLISKSRDKPLRLTSKSQEILRKYTSPLESERSSAGPLNSEPSSKALSPPPPLDDDNFNLNNLIAGSAIRIEDYIKRWK